MSQTRTWAEAVPPADPASQNLSLKDRIKGLPLPVQLLINCGFALLMVISILDFPWDPIPLLDELLIGWLLFTSVQGTLAGIREQREPTVVGDRAAPTVDVRGQQGSSTVAAMATDPLESAAQAEVDALGQRPTAAPAGTAGPAPGPRPAPRRIPVGDNTWKIFDLLRKCRKLSRNLERDGFPDAGKEQLQGIERRVGDLRKRFRELEQLLRTRELDLGLADREIKKLDRRLSTAQGEMERESVQRSMAHAVHHREHVLSVMEARNRYVLRLQELYHHVRQLHSSMMVMDSPAQAEPDELIEEIDALVASVEAVEVVRREVQSTLAGEGKKAVEDVTEVDSDSDSDSDSGVDSQEDSEPDPGPDIEELLAAEEELAALVREDRGGAGERASSSPRERPADEREGPDPRAAARRQRQG